MQVWGDLLKADAATCEESREDKVDQLVCEVIESPEIGGPVFVNQTSLERE